MLGDALRNVAKITDIFIASGSHRFLLAFFCAATLSGCSAQIQGNDISAKADLASIDRQLAPAKVARRRSWSNLASRDIPRSFVAVKNEDKNEVLLPPFYLQAKYVCTPSGFGKTATCSPRNI